MTDLEFIAGLMRENYEAVGFLPTSAIQERYMNGQHIIQTDLAGRRVGYLLHGVPAPGHVLTVAQTVVEYDKRTIGFGNEMVDELIRRARSRYCRSLILKCAEDLDANTFWLAVGFQHTNTLYPNNARRRAINVYTLDLQPTLWKWESV